MMQHIFPFFLLFVFLFKCMHDTRGALDFEQHFNQELRESLLESSSSSSSSASFHTAESPVVTSDEIVLPQDPDELSQAAVAGDGPTADGIEEQGQSQDGEIVPPDSIVLPPGTEFSDQPLSNGDGGGGEEREQDEGERCAICQEGFQPETPGEQYEPSLIYCRNGHTFHEGCIQQWHDRNPSCPTCRGGPTMRSTRILGPGGGLPAHAYRLRSSVAASVGVATMLTLIAASPFLPYLGEELGWWKLPHGDGRKVDGAGSTPEVKPPVRQSNPSGKSSFRRAA